MCRWIVYHSHSEPILLADLLIRPAHSLLKQVDEHYLPGLQLGSPPPEEADDRKSPNSLPNIDGFGIGWYSPVPATNQVYSTPERRIEHPELLPAVYKCISPPLHDYNLQSLANSIESRIVFGHIRASTTGSVQLPNCHPFQFGRFLFMHNGAIGRFAEIQLEVMSLVGARARSFVKGTSDTEWLAALFFHLLDPSETANWLDDFPLSRQLDALARSIDTVIRLVERKGGYIDHRLNELIGWFSANLAISDGEKLIALRFAYPPKRREAPSLYWSETAGSAFDRKYRDHPDEGGRKDVGNKPRKLHQAHVVVASEPTALALWSSNYHTVVGIPPVIPGCFIRPGLGPRLGVSLYWFPAAVNNIVLLILTIVRIFPIWSSSVDLDPPPRSNLCERYSFCPPLYYGVITALSLTLHLLNFLEQNTLASVMVPLALTLPPVLVFHLVLNLRSIAQSPITSEREFEPILMEDLLATESAIGLARGTSETSGQTRRRMLSRENEETDFESRNGTFSRESNSGIEAPAAAAGAVPT
ncbi:hypothetical protein JCM3765_001379 [Sporobolomyces pararoseus]